MRRESLHSVTDRQLRLAAFPSPSGSAHGPRQKCGLYPARRILMLATGFIAPAFFKTAVFFKYVRKPRGRFLLSPEGDTPQRRAFCETSALQTASKKTTCGAHQTNDTSDGRLRRDDAGSMDIRGDGEHMAVKLLECEPAADHNQYE
jgi:hypothetical protein